MKTVTILSIHSKRQAEDAPFTYTVQVPEGKDCYETLEAAFELTNRDDRPQGQNVCSTSPGDLMQLDGQNFLVEGGCFAMLTSHEFEALQTMSSRDTSAGLQWLYKNDLLTTPAIKPLASDMDITRAGQSVALIQDWSDFKKGQHFIIVGVIDCGPVENGGVVCHPKNLRVVLPNCGDPGDKFHWRTVPEEYTVDIPSVGAPDTLYANQGDRDATVLAVVGTEVLYEYEMPAGRTFLRLVDLVKGGYRAISRNNIPKRFQQELAGWGSVYRITAQGRVYVNSLPPHLKDHGV